ncbi:MAG: DUF3574 domain-containing protein [Verrucomicrobiota bacterium]
MFKIIKRVITLNLLGFSAVLIGTGCATRTVDPVVDIRASAEANQWMETSLYFGLRRVGGNAPFKGITEERWVQFLDEEVSPRFPAGFTVVDGYGQWIHMENPDKTPNRLVSKVIILLHPSTEEYRARIEEVRDVFKEQFGQESVLRVTLAAEVSF